MTVVLILQVVLLAVWLKANGRSDALPIAVVFSMALAGAAALLWQVPGEHQLLMTVLGPLMCLPALALLVAAWRRPVPGSADVPVGCNRCNRDEPLAPVRFYRLTGLVVWMDLRADTHYLCRSCQPRALGATVAHNLTLGWWFWLSALATPGIVVINGLAVLRARMRGERDFDAHVRNAMADHADYIEAMVATRDVQTVVDAVSHRTGIDAESVRRYLRLTTGAVFPTATARSSAGRGGDSR